MGTNEHILSRDQEKKCLLYNFGKCRLPAEGLHLCLLTHDENFLKSHSTVVLLPELKLRVLLTLQSCLSTLSFLEWKRA